MEIPLYTESRARLYSRRAEKAPLIIDKTSPLTWTDWHDRGWRSWKINNEVTENGLVLNVESPDTMAIESIRVCEHAIFDSNVSL